MISYSVMTFIFISLILLIGYLNKNSQSYQEKKISKVTTSMLSPRENEVLNNILTGKSPREIAMVLYIEEGTVRTHIKNIYLKLGVHSKEQLFVLFLN